ncbi:aspartate--ammonia ligase [Clostridium acetireducens DSM 10703]|jgi:aspartate--ammonia ligase|uniref:Aspartate--ammonia ligase n=1 Tax=Clostridium acetireducens DSM 10703 TaxID=1121290 RepID=A0A1E8EWA2_9CLOT|nr:aspartate--ammonia ligase [Clostridium acetireducens]OFI01510.1 aspartate--ammonia ligase [Clostridium acetireducens DSM 10703]
MSSMKKSLLIPKGYTVKLNLKQTQIAIKQIKNFFEENLAKELNLTRVTAPMCVKSDSGLNDNLNGVERPVAFTIKGDGEAQSEIVHSLAKWKRLALYRYNFKIGEGLYTDMNAIRRDEDLDNIHSIYVDQWDWEKVIRKQDRNETTLKNIVKNIYKVFKLTEDYLYELYPFLGKILPENIFFITSQELEDMYPNLSPNDREHEITKEKKAVFLMKIGDTLKSGEKHDGRAPDYDDWQLNGDILFWNPVLEMAFELSSMGIRVDEDALCRQLKLTGCEERKNLPFHKLLLEGTLPYTVGGGIGQSRICMFFLRKAHIGEIQSSIWPEDMIKECAKNGIELL